jgi:hypothetical protein
MVTFELFGDRVIWPYFCGLVAALYFDPKEAAVI